MMDLNADQFGNPRLFNPDRHLGISGLTPGVVDDYVQKDDWGEEIERHTQRYTGRLTHRSHRDFSPGDLVLPTDMIPGGGAKNFAPSSGRHAYAYMDNEMSGHEYGNHYSIHNTAPEFYGPNMYEVEPITQDFSDDPYQGNAIRSNKGFRVKGRVTK